MPDDLTPDERRQLDAIDRALSGRAVDPDMADIAQLTAELQGVRETPAPEFARDLDRRAAEWLAESGERTRRRPAWLRAGLPAAAAAAAAVVVAVAVTGGGGDGGESGLELSAVQEMPRSGALAAPQAAPETEAHDDSAAGALPGKELSLERRRVQAGQPLVVRYEVLSTVQAKVDFAGRSGELTLDPGMGRLEIGTADAEPGSQPLSIVLQPGGSLHTRVELTR